jgi:formylglycine-generating enzyme required for sulfatase activity
MTISIDNRNALPTGYQLEEYRIQSLLGHGGFGMTYLAYDTRLNLKVAIKEFFPNELAVRAEAYYVEPKSQQDKENLTWGLEGFLKEGRTLAAFQHPNIVRVLHYFEAHNTAYIVMAYEQGQSLSSILQKRGKPLTESEIMAFLPQLLSGLQVVHQTGFLHRDIKPNNIYIRDQDQNPVLIDFGAARYAFGSHTRSVTTIVTPGYAPFEQYQSKGKQGPWSDIYAMGAILYCAICGKSPMEAPERVNAIKLREEPDPLPSAVQIGQKRYSEGFLRGIDWALQIVEKDRPQTVKEWSDVLLAPSSRLNEIPSTKQDKSGINKWVLGSVIGAIIISFAGYIFYTEQRIAKLVPNSPANEETPRKTPEQVNPINPHEKTHPLTLEKQQATKEEKFDFQDQLKDGTLGPKMVWVPAGSFNMGDIQGDGDKDEKPVHSVSINRFAIGLHEITVGEYLHFVQAKGYVPEWQEVGSKYNIDTGTDTHYKELGSTLTNEKHPIVGISWKDATAYAKWLSQQTNQQYRLPSEAEWEYAARAGTETKYYWGNEIGYNQANCSEDYCGDDFNYTAPVGSFAPNTFGLYDTVGNVWEWTCSEYKKYGNHQEKQCAVQNPSKERVSRGGSWKYEPWDLRTTFRVRYSPSDRINDLGLYSTRE